MRWFFPLRTYMRVTETGVCCGGWISGWQGRDSRDFGAQRRGQDHGPSGPLWTNQANKRSRNVSGPRCDGSALPPQGEPRFRLPPIRAIHLRRSERDRQLEAGSSPPGRTRPERRKSGWRKFGSSFDTCEEIQPARADIKRWRQRMLSLGIALMVGPAVLLLDEPSLGLAPALANDIMVVVKELAESGRHRGSHGRTGSRACPRYCRPRVCNAFWTNHPPKRLAVTCACANAYGTYSESARRVCRRDRERYVDENVGGENCADNRRGPGYWPGRRDDDGRRGGPWLLTTSMRPPLCKQWTR